MLEITLTPYWSRECWRDCKCCMGSRYPARRQHCSYHFRPVAMLLPAFKWICLDCRSEIRERMSLYGSFGRILPYELPLLCATRFLVFHTNRFGFPCTSWEETSWPNLDLEVLTFHLACQVYRCVLHPG